MIEVDKDTIEAFASLFRGRTDSQGRVNECIYEPVTLKHYEKHLKGEINLGIYFVLDDSTCHFAAVDLDQKNFTQAKAIRDELVKVFIPAYIAASKSKGFHIYIFALERFKAVEIRQVLKHVLDKLNIKAEVFPKQDYHQPDDPDGTKHPGSYINLPSFGYTRHFLTGAIKEVPLEIALERIKFVPQESIDRVLQVLPKETSKEKPPVSNKGPKEKAQEELLGEELEKFNKTAVKKLLETCTFLKHCRKDAATLLEPHWWSMVHVLAVFGDLGREKIHELSQPYPGYTEKETNQKIDEAKKATDKEIGPHTCTFIERDLGFDCPKDCPAKKLEVKSPAGMAKRLASQEIHGVYLYKDKTGWHLNLPKLVDDLLSDHSFKTIFGIVRDDILIYEDGVYTYNGEKVIREECEKRVPKKFMATHSVSEVKNHIARSTFTEREQFDTEKYIINLRNGLLDVNTRELKPHTPDFLSTVRMPIVYDPKAECPRVQGFLDSVLEEKDKEVILEFFGYTLIPDYSIPVVLMLLGEGANGKTQLLRLLARFIGKTNYTSISLQDIEDDSFAVANLENKLLNIQGDLSSKWLSGVGMLKKLSGQDPIYANRKHRDPIQFDNFARLVFASNKPPEIEEDTLAIWRRILPMNLPNVFEGKKDIKNYVDAILTPQELSGLLNLTLESLQGLLARGDFSYQGSYSDRSRHYTIASAPARVFVEECCNIGADYKILKSELYQAYILFCKNSKIQLSGESQFGKELRRVPGLSIGDKQYQEKGERVRWWLGIAAKNLEPETTQIDMEF